MTRRDVIAINESNSESYNEPSTHWVSTVRWVWRLAKCRDQRQTQTVSLSDTSRSTFVTDNTRRIMRPSLAGDRIKRCTLSTCLPLSVGKLGYTEN